VSPTQKKGVYGQAPMAQVSTHSVRWCPRLKRGFTGVSPVQKKKKQAMTEGRKAWGIFVGVFIFLFLLGFLVRTEYVG